MLALVILSGVSFFGLVCFFFTKGLSEIISKFDKKGNNQEFIQINSISCSCSFHSRLFRSGAIGSLQVQEIATLQKNCHNLEINLPAYFC